MSRLSLACREGLVLPPGRALVLYPPIGADLTELNDLQIVQPFKPAHDHFAAAGYDMAMAPQGDFAVAMVFVTRSRDESRDLIAQAAGLADVVIVDGQKTDGIESHLRDVRNRAAVERVVSKAHGKLFAFTGGSFDDWRASPGHVEGFVTRPGVFSHQEIDEGSRLLGSALPQKLPRLVADFGAGWGYLSAQILQRDSVETLHLVEANHNALHCARANINDARAQFHWADALTFTPPKPLDCVVMNPPFHTGRSADPQIGRAFIAAAARALARHGQLWLVANRHLPYEAEASQLFAQVKEVAGNARFKILLAEKPRRRTG